MKYCAFLSMDNLDDFVCYDHLLVDPLQDLGWTVNQVSWRNDQINWNQFDVVVIRSPWDYQDDPAAFLQTLQTIEASDTLLENRLDLVKWNLDKTYLKELEEQSIEIVPSLWRTTYNQSELDSFFEEFESNEIIIKPTVSANADDTFRIQQSEQDKYQDKIRETFANRAFLVQPFMDNIITEGEFSVFFFGDTYSHTILKTPKPKDFRVQEEHGGNLKSIEHPAKGLLKSARKLLQKFDPLPLYSRMDYVRTESNSFALMEIELIEPSLYFNMDTQSPARFAKVFDRRMREKLAQLSP